MNIVKIVNVCKKAKRLDLYSRGDMQWISDGFAIFPLLGAPKFSVDSIRATYDLPDSVEIREHGELPRMYCFDDICASENQIFYEKIQVCPSGHDLLALRTQRGVTFIQRKYVEPVDDGAPAIGIYERITEAGQLYIVIKRGLLLEAVIMPMTRVIQKDWLEDLRELVSMLSATYAEEGNNETY